MKFAELEELIKTANPDINVLDATWDCCRTSEKTDYSDSKSDIQAVFVLTNDSIYNADLWLASVAAKIYDMYFKARYSNKEQKGIEKLIYDVKKNHFEIKCPAWDEFWGFVRGFWV